MNEEWRPVVGYEGLYEVSDQGRVRSLTRRVTMSPGSRFKEKTIQGRFLKINTATQYPSVDLNHGMKRQIGHVHTLICEAFIGPRPEGMVTRHLDGNPKNSVLSNLAYGTYSENSTDMLEHGTRRFGEKIHNSKLNAQAVSAIRASSETLDQLAMRYGVHSSTIWKVLHRITWAHL